MRAVLAFILVFAAAAAGLFAAGAVKAQLPAWLIAEGNRYYAAGDLARAAQTYLRASRLEPTAAEAMANIGNVRKRQFKTDAAKNHYFKALDVAGPDSKGRIHYNLAATLHQQAVEAMLTFQDAKTRLQSAIRHYRESLSYDPGFEDARYNLELAHRLLEELKLQRPEAQRNAEIRNQTPSPNKGQAFESEIGNKGAPQKEAPKTGSDLVPGAMTQEGSNSQSSDAAARMQTPDQPQQNDISPEDAQRAVELMRQRADAMAAQRRGWRGSRIKEAESERNW